MIEWFFPMVDFYKAWFPRHGKLLFILTWGVAGAAVGLIVGAAIVEPAK